MTTLDRSTPWGCFFAVTVLLAGAANAQGQRPTAPSDSARHWRLALADAVALALQHNPMLKARAIDVRMAQARVVETSGRDDVVLSAKAAWLTDANQQATGGLVQNPYDAFQVQTQLVRPLPTGGTIGLQLESAYTRFRSDRLGPEVPSQWITPSIALTLRHPILRGAGTAVVRAEQRSARAQKSVAVLQEEASSPTCCGRSVRRTGASTMPRWRLRFGGPHSTSRRSSCARCRPPCAWETSLRVLLPRSRWRSPCIAPTC